MVHQAILLPSKNGKDQPEPTNHFEIHKFIDFSIVFDLSYKLLPIVFNISYKLLASGQLKDQIPGVPKCEDGEEESEKEQSQNIYKAGGFHLMGIGADGHGGRGLGAVL